SFSLKHNDIIASIYNDGYDQVRLDNLKETFGLEADFATEVMYSQRQSNKMRGKQKPFTEEERKEIKENISHPFISNYLLQQSDALENTIEEKLLANKTKTGYVINETPKTEGDRLFETIVEKYKGKV